MTLSDRTLKRRRPGTVARLLTAAIEDGWQIELLYKRPTTFGYDEELRRVSPYEVQGDLVIGWDHVRRDFRSFKLAKIAGAALLDVPRFEQEQA